MSDIPEKMTVAVDGSVPRSIAAALDEMFGEGAVVAGVMVSRVHRGNGEVGWSVICATPNGAPAEARAEFAREAAGELIRRINLGDL